MSDTATRPIGRTWSVVASTTAVLAAGLVALPTTASAAGADALSFGGDRPAITVGANAVVRIDGRLTYETSCGRDGFPDFVYPATDVYVVSAAPGAGGALEDAAGGPPNTIISTASLFLGEIIAITTPSGDLGEGTYSVVYDTCQDGRFDAGVDTVFPDVLTVRLPAVLPPASMAIIDLKGAAEEEAYSWKRTHALFETIEKVQGIPDLISTLMSPDIDAITGILLGEAVGGFSFTGGVSEGFKRLLVNQARNYAAIAADPPDRQFRQVTAIAPVPAAVSGDGAPLTEAMAGALVPMAGEAALAEALLHAIERYQGAQAAGDAEWALTHARQAADLAAALAEQTGATSGALTALRDAVAGAPGNVDGAYAAVREYSHRMTRSGFTADERRHLANLGFSAAEIGARETASRAFWQRTPVDRGRIVAQLDEVLAAHTATATTATDSAAAFGALVDQLEAQPAVPDVAPVADAGGPYTATQGTALALDGSASRTPSVSDVTEYAWDLDADGAFDDATGATPSATFPRAGSQVVGLRVTNSLDRQAVGYATVEVTGAGSARAVPAVTPDVRNVLVTVGTPQAFTADGDVTWLVDGAEVGTGAAWTWDVAADDVGIHVVEARAADGGSRRWDAAVVDVDADGDGWTATSDCDETDAAVSPGMFDLLGNGVDDDCDAGSPDAPPGGLTGTPWTWGGNFLGAGGIGPISGDYIRPPREMTGFDDVVQVERGFRMGHVVRADGRILGWGNNFSGELGDGTNSHRNRPVPVVGVNGSTPELTGVVEVSTGGSSPHSAALRTDGTVVSWGRNTHRQLGDGSTVDHRAYPVPVLGAGGAPLTGVRSVEAGNYQTYALMDDGSVQTWGASHCSGKSLVTHATATPVPGLTSGVRQVSSGYGWTMVRMSDGSVLSCGGNPGVLGRRPTQAQPDHTPHPISTFGPGSGVVDVSAGYNHGVALKSDGSVWTWGTIGNGSLEAVGATTTLWAPVQVPLPPGPPVVDVEAAESCHTQALRADGSVLIWGCDTHGSSGIVPAGTVRSPTVLQIPADVIATSSSIWNGLALARPVDDGFRLPAFWVTASVADTAGSEGSPGAFEVTLSEALPHDVTVDWSVAAGTAGEDDLVLDGGRVTVPAGSTSASIPAPVVDDALDEADEEYTLVLTGASHDVSLARSQATGTITDDDEPPAVSVADVTVAEGDTSLTDVVVPVRLSAASTAPVTVTLTTADGSATAPDDYAATTFTVTVPAGATEAAAHLAVHGDREMEADETFAVRLSDPEGAVLGDAAATVTLTDDEPLALTVAGSSVTEGDGGTTPATFTVRLSPPAPDGTTVTVPWSLAAGTAEIPADVAAADGVLTFAAGESERTVEAAVVGDDDPEPAESFRLVVGDARSSDGRVVLPPDTARAVIEDDDPADVAPTVEAGPDVSGTEGAGMPLSATVTDPDSTPAVAWSASPGPDVDAGARCTFAPADAAATTVTCTDDGTWTLTAAADDGVNPAVGDDLILTVANAAPDLGAVAVAVPADGMRTLSAPVVDPGDDTSVCTFDWGDGTPGTTVAATPDGCTATHRFAPGAHSVGVTVEDDDGGTDTAAARLLVYGWAGFFAPVANPPAVNTVTAGQAIPVKFGLGGYQGPDVLAEAFPASRPCGSEGPLTPTSLPGSADLTYATGSDRYQYVWKTDRSWRGTCRELVVRFADGSERSALFRFR